MIHEVADGADWWGLQAVNAWQQVPGHDLRFRGCLIEPMRCVFRG